MSVAVEVSAVARSAKSVVPDDLDAAFARFLRLDVANGDASADTVRGYRSQLAAWVAWCAEHTIDARIADTEDVKRYREDLVAQGRQPTTIAHKLNVLRRIYAAAVAAGLLADNPAVGIRAPRDRRAPEDFGYLSEVELALLFRAVPHDDKLKHLRDRALLGLLGLQALRTIEIMRANVADLQRRGDDWALLVHGKSHDRLVFLRPDVAEALRGYLAARGRVPEDADGEPLLAAVGNFARGHRLSRRGVRHVVDAGGRGICEQRLALRSPDERCHLRSGIDPRQGPEPGDPAATPAAAPRWARGRLGPGRVHRQGRGR